MAIVTRYFSTSGAGAADGTTWANRAALFSAGNWSTVVTGFAFNGSDSLKCLIGPGTYTCSQSLAGVLFANAPTSANPLLLCGADSSGNLLAIPDPAWKSSMPSWDISTMPVIATTTNISHTTLVNAVFYLLRLTASGRNGTMAQSSLFEWCSVLNSTTNTSAVALSATAINCWLECSGTSYANVWSSSVGLNVRCKGPTGSSGNRHGLIAASSSSSLSGITITGVGGDGMSFTSGSTSFNYMLREVTIANIGGTGLKLPATASQTVIGMLQNSLITGCGAYAIDAQSASWLSFQGNRFRDNTTGNFNGLGNYPTDLNNYTTDSDDATEYVDAANGDFRIKPGCLIWGKGYGAGDAPGVIPRARFQIGM